MSLILLSTDLAIGSFVRGAAEQAGVAFRLALDAASLIRQIQDEAPSLVILDLDTRTIDVASLMPQLRAANLEPCGVIAFGPHVHAARLQAAEEAGCDLVLSRGKFHAQAAAVIGRYAAVRKES